MVVQSSPRASLPPSLPSPYSFSASCSREEVTRGEGELARAGPAEASSALLLPRSFPPPEDASSSFPTLAPLAPAPASPRASSPARPGTLCPFVPAACAGAMSGLVRAERRGECGEQGALELLPAAGHRFALPCAGSGRPPAPPVAGLARPPRWPRATAPARLSPPHSPSGFRQVLGLRLCARLPLACSCLLCPHRYEGRKGIKHGAHDSVECPKPRDVGGGLGLVEGNS